MSPEWEDSPERQTMIEQAERDYGDRNHCLNLDCHEQPEVDGELCRSCEEADRGRPASLLERGETR